MNQSYLQIVANDIGEILKEDLDWERFSGKRFAVTGASGFIGSYLVRCLLSLNPSGKTRHPVEVTGIIRNRGKARNRFSDLLPDRHFSLIECDLSHPETLDISADYFIHAASQASPKYYGVDPVGTLAPNVVGTYKLLALAQACNAHGFLFVSSSEIYGSVTDRPILTESDYGIVDPASVRASYAESKRMGENLCISWMHQYRLPTYIVRPFHTYGPGVELNDGRVFADFVNDIVQQQHIRMNSDGSARRAFCYITDLISGIMHVLLKGTPGIPYNIANPEGDLAIAELAEILVGLYPEKELKVIRNENIDNRGYLKSNIQKLIPNVDLLKSLGWMPKILPGTGFRKMTESYL